MTASPFLTAIVAPVLATAEGGKTLDVLRDELAAWLAAGGP